MHAVIIRKKIKKILTSGLYGHSIAVESTAREIAKRFGYDEEKCAIASLLHDISKMIDEAEMLEFAREKHLKIDLFMKESPKLLHGKISEYLAEHSFAIKDRSILLAIKNHTFGRPRMCNIEKAVYVADHIEPGRKYRGLKKIRKVAKTDINGAITLIAEEMIKYLRKRNLPVHIRTIVTRDYYLTNGANK